MRKTAALISAVFIISIISCGKGAQLNLAKPNKSGRLEDWLRDPSNYKPFYYNEKQKPGTGKAEFRFIVTKSPVKVAVPDLTGDYIVDADVVIALREKNKYQAFIATYLNCAEAVSAETPAAAATSEVVKTSNDKAAVPEVDPASLLPTAETDELDASQMFTNAASAAAFSKTKRGVLIGYTELGADGTGLDWNTNGAKLNLVGLGIGTKTLAGKRDLSLTLTFDDAMKKLGFETAAIMSTRRHLKSYEEFQSSKPTNITKLADAQTRVKKDCKDVDADVFKFDALPSPNPLPGPTPPKRTNPRPAPPAPPTPSKDPKKHP